MRKRGVGRERGRELGRKGEKERWVGRERKEKREEKGRVRV